MSKQFPTDCEDDGIEVKCVAAIFIAIVVGYISTVIVERVHDHKETLQAMESGYIQQVDPDTRKVLWVKPTSDL